MYLLVLLFRLTALAQDSWICTEDSSQIQGSRILACGVGEDPLESVARKKAFNSAAQEFSIVCGPQTLCGQHKYSVAPSRSTCNEEKGIWKCYRAIVYEIEEEERSSAIAQPDIVVDVKRESGMNAALKYGIGRGW